MRELSLFTGAGGGILGTKLLGWKTVGYVEYDEYCQRILAQRIEDGIFDRAPIFGDIRTFADKYAEQYQGVVDVITAGFPCQPFSAAGQRRGSSDDRNMWPATISVIRKVQPKWCLLENVPGLLARHGYFGTVLKDLAEGGFDAEWGCLSAASVGAPHKRERLWILAANTKHDGHGWGQQFTQGAKEASYVPDSKGERLEGSKLQRGCECKRKGTGDGSGKVDMADAASNRLERRDERLGSAESAGARLQSQSFGGCCGSSGWWSAEPNMGRVADGVAFRRNRLRALGNGQVPAVVREAWRRLNG